MNWHVLVLFCVSFILTKAYILCARKFGIFDIPSARSLHLAPTARGGGIAVLICFGIVLYHFRMKIPYSQMAALITGVGIAFVGFWDDFWGLHPSIRLIMHLSCAAIAVHFLPTIERLPLAGESLTINFVIGTALAFFTIIWFINLFNFMDGIDGLLAFEVISACLGMGALILIFSDDNSPLLLINLAICVGGFVVWNLPKASVFMGDVGSGFLGYVLSVLMLDGISRDEDLVWPWMILLSLFWVDATLTLCRRAFRGETIYQAHRSHAYQHAAILVGGHALVSYGYLAVNIFYLFPLAWLSLKFPSFSLLFTCLAVFPIALYCIYMGCGVENSETVRNKTIVFNSRD